MDASYLRKIRQAPLEDRLRLDYARMLDARGRAAAATWVRAEVALARRPDDVGAREAFHQARAALPDTWRLSMEQPRLLRTTGLPLTAQWIGLGLGRARPAHGAYQRYPYASVPAIPEHLASGWSWIEKGPSATLVNGSTSRSLASVEGAAANLGYSLPANFMQLFDRYVGQREVIRSCTGGRFDLDGNLWRPAEALGGLLVPFYLDGETSLGWGLWLHPGGSEAVLAFSLTPTIGASAPPPRLSHDYQVVELFWVSPSLTSWVYRFATEHHIWFAQHGRGESASLDALTYLAHYRT